MNIFTSIPDLAQVHAPVHLAIGVFDGVHRGHQAVIANAVASAQEHGGEAVLVTFEPHPIQILAPDKAPRTLTSHAHQMRLVAEQGVTQTLVIPFNKAFSRRSGEEFVGLLVNNVAQLISIHVGEDWCFGHQRSGTVDLLEEQGAKHGFHVHAVPHVAWRDETVSSTLVRRAIQDGNLARARDLLGRDFTLSGVVQQGKQLARGFGFPTANIPLGNLQLPPFGVYVSRVTIADQCYGAIVNLGVRPTLDNAGAMPLLEVHLFGFEGDLYELSLEVPLLKHLRAEQRFEDLEALKNQIANDMTTAKAWLASSA